MTSAGAPHLAPVVALAVVNVSNDGVRDGDYVGLLFARPPRAGVGGVPLQVLVDFQRVRIAGGSRRSLHFPIRASSLALAGALGEWEIAAPGDWTFFLSEQHGNVEVSAALSVR